MRNFIQPGVTQWYRKPLAIPAEASVIHIWAAFEYRGHLGVISRFLAKLLLQPPEERESVTYTVRRTFAVSSR
jgi:hypothetical protein